MHKFREGLPELPARIKALPVDERGYPVPWFVSWVDGKPEFRAMDGEKLVRAVKEKRCWVCGQPLGKFLTFVIGPMCAINRISPEPPSHRDCAIFSARACPFLSKPQMVRRMNDLPEEISDHGAASIKRNPGVCLVWITNSYKTEQIETGILFKVGIPLGVICYAQGRLATPGEIRHSIETGLPLLMQAATEDEYPEIFKRRDAAYKLLGCAVVA